MSRNIKYISIYKGSIFFALFSLHLILLDNIKQLSVNKTLYPYFNAQNPTSHLKHLTQSSHNSSTMFCNSLYSQVQRISSKNYWTSFLFVLLLFKKVIKSLLLQIQFFTKKDLLHNF